jgi:hypothetical protein
MKPRHLILVILPVALLLAYPLSLGPVFKWRWEHGMQYPSALAAFYRPLAVICEYVPPAGEAMNRYLELWVPGLFQEPTAFEPAKQ